MDQLDRAIIHHLMVDGRLANTELADRVGLSPTPCLRRVRRLEAQGVITGYHASVDPAALGQGFEVLLHVEMGLQDRATLEAFETQVDQIDEITQCRRMFGHPDYLLWIATSDLQAYERLYMDKLTDLPGVARTHSQFTMKTVKTDVTTVIGAPPEHGPRRPASRVKNRDPSVRSSQIGARSNTGHARREAEGDGREP